MSLILPAWLAEAVYGSNVPPNVIVTIPAPARWPLNEPWPPKVTLAAPPCWRCITG